MTDEHTELFLAVDSLWIEAGNFRRDIYRHSFTSAKSSIAFMRNYLNKIEKGLGLAESADSTNEPDLMKVTLLDSYNQQVTEAYIPFDTNSRPNILLWDGRLFLRVIHSDPPTYKEASYYSVPLATCTELPPAQNQTEGIDKYSRLDIRLQAEMLLNHSALGIAIELLTNYLAKDSRVIHEMLKDLAVEFVQTQTPEEIQEWAAAIDRAAEKADKSGADRITIISPDFGR